MQSDNIFLCGPKPPTEEDLRIARAFDTWLRAHHAGTLVFHPNCLCGGNGFAYQCCGHVISDGVTWPDVRHAD